jgi:hypothetical protein
LTHDTTKLSLAFAVAAFGMPACAASLTGIGRIDNPDRHTCALRLVVDKRSQLAEGPIALSCSLLWPCNPRPRANALEVFKHNRPLRAFGFGNQPLADVVVGICLKTPLTPPELMQAAFGRFRADFLKCLPTPLIPLAAAFNVLA